MKLCGECVYGMYADTLVCDKCSDDVCFNEKCENVAGFTCNECETTWCDSCLPEVVCCDFCEKCENCDPVIYPCAGCEEDYEEDYEEPVPYTACTTCRLNMGWIMRTEYRTAEVIVCCPYHPQGSVCMYDPINEDTWTPLNVHETLMV